MAGVFAVGVFAVGAPLQSAAGAGTCDAGDSRRAKPEVRCKAAMTSGSSLPPRGTVNEVLVATVKAIVANARAGKLDAAYSGYRELFASAAFRGYEPQDRRQALRLMVHAKGVPDPPTPAMVEAMRVAIGPLSDLVGEFGEPADFEMLGVCQVAIGDENSAGQSFRAGLSIERDRNLQSDLCGALMKRISML